MKTLSTSKCWENTRAEDNARMGGCLMGGVLAFHRLRARREDDPPDAKLFRYNHEEGFRKLLKSLNLYTDPKSGLTRNTKISPCDWNQPTT